MKSGRDPLLNRAFLIKVGREAGRAASKRAFEVVDKLLVAQDGWLVYVDKDGNVVEKVRKL